MKNKLKYLLVTILLLAFSSCFAIFASADEVAETEASQATTENVFAKAYNEIAEYAGEILCAMTFAGSLILAIAYKKGLLPLVKGSLVSIGNAVGKIKESTNESIEKSSRITEDLDVAKNMLDMLSEKVDTLELMLEKRIATEVDAEKEKADFKLILTSQIDMLYDIFMTSALPQYQKDAVGEKIAAMKGALGENGKQD